jgi:phosphohistidine phosphatase
VKRLTILRHAKSSRSDDRLADRERLLSQRGERDAPQMGKRLARHGLKPDLILSSPAVRARQTAERVALALNYRADDIRYDAALYLASPGDLLEVLANVNDGIDELILVGHNPGMTQLANMMLAELKLNNLPTAGAVAIDTGVPSWGQIDAGAFSLRFYDYPKNADQRTSQKQ